MAEREAVLSGKPYKAKLPAASEKVEKAARRTKLAQQLVVEGATALLETAAPRAAEAAASADRQVEQALAAARKAIQEASEQLARASAAEVERAWCSGVARAADPVPFGSQRTTARVAQRTGGALADAQHWIGQERAGRRQRLEQGEREAGARAAEQAAA
jgi:hypothetical protein